MNSESDRIHNGCEYLYWPVTFILIELSSSDQSIIAKKFLQLDTRITHALFSSPYSALRLPRTTALWNAIPLRFLAPNPYFFVDVPAILMLDFMFGAHLVLRWRKCVLRYG